MKYSTTYRGQIERVYRITCGVCIGCQYTGTSTMPHAVNQKDAAVKALSHGWTYDARCGYVCPMCSRESSVDSD